MDCLPTPSIRPSRVNTPARALYAAHGYAEAGRRPGYYARKDAPSEAAIILRRALT